MSDSLTPSRDSENALDQKNYNVPVRLNDISIFDGAFTFMKERFTEEMRRIEDEMALISKNLFKISNEVKSYHAGVTSDRHSGNSWEVIANSPLVEGEGEDKTLRLQFDVSQFEPSEVLVKVLGNTLVVTGQHEEKSDGNITYCKYHREFLFPFGVDPEAVESTLSKDGVLTIKAPLNLIDVAVKDSDSILKVT